MTNKKHKKDFENALSEHGFDVFDAIVSFHTDKLDYTLWRNKYGFESVKLYANLADRRGKKQVPLQVDAMTYDLLLYTTARLGGGRLNETIRKALEVLNGKRIKTVVEKMDTPEETLETV